MGLSTGWLPASRRGVSTAVLLVVAVGLSLVACGGIEGDAVGPDADQLAGDPLLDIEVDDADTAYETATQGREGGVAPALENPISDATRAWDLETNDWQPILAAVVGKADDLDVTFWELSCTENLIVYTGAKRVATGDDTVIAAVTISMNTGSSPPRLRIELASDGTMESTSPPAGQGSATPDEECPADLADSFAALIG